MKGSTLASLKFSGVPGKFLICAVFPFSRLLPYVRGWRAVVLCRSLCVGTSREQVQTPVVSCAPQILWDASVCPGLRDARGDGTKWGTPGMFRGKWSCRCLCQALEPLLIPPAEQEESSHLAELCPGPQVCITLPRVLLEEQGSVWQESPLCTL